jgi:hypothetical protein
VDACGIVHSTCGLYFADDHAVNWQYGDPPGALAELALECAATAGEFAVPGATWEGNESASEMDHQVAARCTACGVVQTTIDVLSEIGNCLRCTHAAQAVPRWRICKERRTSAGIATEDCGLILHASDAGTAVANAKALGMFGGMKLVAIPEIA